MCIRDSNIAANKADIGANTDKIGKNADAIADNKQKIADNKTAIDRNTSDIATNKGDIASNKANIAQNTAAIARKISLGGNSGSTDEKSLKMCIRDSACSWHAGDPLIMDATVRMCKEKGVAVGAHPGYPDLMGFGRRAMAVNPAEAKAYMIYQLGALQAFCDSYDISLQHMKLHGAFYNTACVTRCV